MAQDGEQRYAVPNHRVQSAPAPSWSLWNGWGVLGGFSGMLRQVSFGPFMLDIETRQLVRDPGRSAVHLSPKAYDLLCVLVETRPKAIARPICTNVYGLRRSSPKRRCRVSWPSCVTHWVNAVARRAS